MKINESAKSLDASRSPSWRRKWQPPPVFQPGESCGRRSLVGCSPQCRTESDTTEETQRACMHWRRKCQPTPVFLPEESQGQRSLVGCHPWGRTEQDTTEATQQQQQQKPFLNTSCNFAFLLSDDMPLFISTPNKLVTPSATRGSLLRTHKILNKTLPGLSGRLSLQKWLW